MKRKLKTSQAQLKANRRWKSKNKEKVRFYSHKSECKNFILNWASMSNLRWIKNTLIPERINRIKKLLK